MALFWLAVSYAIFLPVLALLLLLLLPLPATVRHYAVRFVKAVLFFRLQVTGFRNGVPLIIVVLVVVGTLFVGSAREAWSADETWAASGEAGHRDKSVLLHKFRAERNAWVAGFGFTLWVVLWRIYTLMERLVEQHREARDLKAAVVRLQAEAAATGAAVSQQAGAQAAAPPPAAAPPAPRAVHCEDGDVDPAPADDISEVAGALDRADAASGLRRRH